MGTFLDREVISSSFSVVISRQLWQKIDARIVSGRENAK